MRKVHIDSEIGVLRRIIVHTPGLEIEAMTPKEAERDLYNDIIPLENVRQEYRQLREFLGLVAQAYDLVDLLAECLEDAGHRYEFLQQFGRLFPLSGVMNQLMASPAQELAQRVLTGIRAPYNTLLHVLDNDGFAARPLPNAYFMRDSLAVVGTSFVSAAFAYDVRIAEAIITRFIFTHHPDFRNDGMLFDGPAERNRLLTAEGGDIHVLAPRVLAIGVSERTSAFAVDTIARRFAKKTGEPVKVFAVDLPKERATIHLDMVFTMIDRDAALVYHPVILGSQRARVVRLDASPDGSINYAEEGSLLEGLRKAGLDLEPVLCGNGRSIYQEREQWLSGSNSFAFAPGKILMYSCNAYTLEALSNHGFEVVSAAAILQGCARPEEYRRLVVAFDGIELARGGGGARCMTLPVLRDSL